MRIKKPNRISAADGAQFEKYKRSLDARNNKRSPRVTWIPTINGPRPYGRPRLPRERWHGAFVPAGDFNRHRLNLARRMKFMEQIPKNLVNATEGFERPREKERVM